MRIQVVEAQGETEIAHHTVWYILGLHSRNVRTVAQDDEHLFVAKDICDILEVKNGRQALTHLDDDEKGVSNVVTLGGNQQFSVVNESGVYSLVMRSRKPEAKRFRKWVTSEVLPTIRKTGDTARN